MRCRVCGSNNEDGSKFCWNCGNKLTEQSETRSSSVNQPGIQQNSGDVQHNQVGTPPKQVRITHARRTSVGSISKYSAMPPHTPQSIQFTDDL